MMDENTQMSSKTGECFPTVKRQKTSHSSEAGDSGLQKSMNKDSGHSKRQFKDKGSTERSSMETETLQSCSTIVAPLKMWAFSEEDVEHQLEECRSVLQEVSRTLSNIPAQSNPNKVNWNSQLLNLEQQAVLPQTSIAVVGDTGAGKSSLLNALLEEEAVLPTSAMRACTSVVVQVSQNLENEHYEADVEFFTEEEWNKELETLITDMKDKSGRFKKHCPDPETEAGIAYSRVMAVYGKIAEIHELKQIQDVTCYLGTVKHISEKQVTNFRTEIEKFIDSCVEDSYDEQTGEGVSGDLWPIVKCIQIRVPKSEVLKTGVVLVDFPGIRDSNSARNNIAKQHLKTCDAVWIVANITRAVDDKTTKDLLNENMRRQLLMDGHYKRIAFICTKTDTYNISDISKALRLRQEIRPLQEKIVELEKQLTQATTHKEKSHLERKTQEKRRVIGLTCVKARNTYSKQRIQREFSEGLQEMKRKFASIMHKGDKKNDNHEDIIGYRELLPSSEPQGNGNDDPYQESSLHVFTVSSTEFLKLRGKFLRDGPPVVFNTEEETEIPALKSFAQQMALRRRTIAAEKLIRSVASLVSQVVTYLINQEESQEAQVQAMVLCCITELQNVLQQAAEECSQDIQKHFSDIEVLLNVGVDRAIATCEDTVRSWGCPESDAVGRFTYPVYKAICARLGFLILSSNKQIDFNQDLSEPLYKAISISWSLVFSIFLLKSLDQFKQSVLQILEKFFQEVKDKLHSISASTTVVVNVQNQQLIATNAELQNFVLDLETTITERQRDISRVLNSTVQKGMVPAYQACGQQTGKGFFRRMKSLMCQHVHLHKSDIFNSASKKLMEQLDLLQRENKNERKSFGAANKIGKVTLDFNTFAFL
nr:PREDICTED: nuclear GTPase SLIP-GC-like isoform X2 [Latimeria chalumnae]|eukprot:XP_014344341.1 PREDICTED: nuclear GTPase SLIP-GC-like isoform X2 [Latimeria chalumnae]